MNKGTGKNFPVPAHAAFRLFDSTADHFDDPPKRRIVPMMDEVHTRGIQTCTQSPDKDDRPKGIPCVKTWFVQNAEYSFRGFVEPIAFSVFHNFPFVRLFTTVTIGEELGVVYHT